MTFFRRPEDVLKTSVSAGRRSIMNVFIFHSLDIADWYGCFHSRKLNNHINNVHEPALIIIFRDSESTFQQLLKQNESVSIDQRNQKKPTNSYQRDFILSCHVRVSE